MATTSRLHQLLRPQLIAPYAFLAPVVILFAGFKFYPYGYALWLSLTKAQGGRTIFVGLDNYFRLLRDPLFFKAFSNTVQILVVQVPIMLTLAVLISVALNSARLRFRAAVRMSYFVPIVMGLVAYGILFSALLDVNRGFVNFAMTSVGLPRVRWLSDPFWAKISIGVAMTWHYVGYNAIIYLAQLQSIPNDLYEAATIDGANSRQSFWHITLPGLRPALILTLILSTIGTLQLFDEPYVLTNGGPDNATITIGMYLYLNGFQFFDFGYASAIGYAMALVIGGISLLQFYLMREKQP